MTERKHNWPKEAPLHVSRDDGYTQSCSRCPAKRRWSKMPGRWYYNSAVSPGQFWMKVVPPCDMMVYWERKPAVEAERPWFETMPEVATAFKNLGPRKGAIEYMLRVGWTGVNDPGDDGRGHLVMRDMVTVDLGIDPGDKRRPPFTWEEMQSIAFAAKMAALKCLFARKGRKGKG